MYNDLLDREGIIDNIVKIIDASSTSLSFDIEGTWGIGKSFLLEMLKERIGNLNKAEQRYLVLSYNCWKYDYYEEPLIAIISSIINNLEDPTSNILKSFANTTKNKILNTFKNIASSFMKNKIGVDLIGIYEEYRVDLQKSQNEKNEFDYYQGFTKAIASVRKQISKLTDEYKIILIIDELDRCLPTYSIKVMERVHHLFEESNNVVVIYSLERLQLENTIKNIFGEKTNSSEYLKKFIDFTIPLNTGETMDYRHYFTTSLINMLNSNFNYNIEGENEINVIKFYSNLFSSIEIRKVKKFIQKIEVILNLILNKDSVDYSLMGAILIYMFYKNDYQQLLDDLFNINNSKNCKYNDVRKFLDIKHENSINFTFINLYEKFEHNIAYILYASEPIKMNKSRANINRVNTFKNLVVEIDLFRKFKDFSSIIK